MISPRRYFPWRVASSQFIARFGLLLAVIFGLGFSLRSYFYSRLGRTVEQLPALGDFDRYLTSLLLVVFIFGLIAIVLSTYRDVEPLGRLVQKIRALRRHDRIVEDDGAEEELDPGEWSDLERAMTRLNNDLRERSEALVREREELSTLLSSLSDGIVAIDLDGIPLFFNPQFAWLFPVRTSGGKLQRISEIFRVPEILAAFREVLAGGPSCKIPCELHTQQSQLARHFQVAISPLRASQDKPVHGAVAVFHDVTELRAAEQIRIEFVGNASHELRTPLTSIKGYLDTVREDIRAKRFDEVPSFLEIISKNVERLMFLVSDLLDLSSIESGAELSKEAVPVRELTELVLKQLESKRAHKHIVITPRYDAAVVQGDQRRIEQVLINLVQNAIKYVPDGSRIEVHWSEDDSTVRLCVRDNGPGIPPEHQARLFERFYRVDAGRSREQGGTGLGLAIVKHIMLKHGGSVQLKSRWGEGSEFVCTFPL